MSIQAKLYVEGNVYNVLQYHFSIQQPIDGTGRPMAFANGKELHFMIEGNRDTLFFEWVSDPKMMKNCKIEIPSRFGMSKSRTIELYDVYCSLSEDRFNALDEHPYTVSFALSAAQLVNNGVPVYQKVWKITDLSEDVAPTTREEDPELVNYYITDTDDNELDEYEIGQHIRLHIETANAIGKKLTLSLADKTHDFKYNGNILKDDTLKDYQISSDKETIELQVIDQQN